MQGALAMAALTVKVFWSGLFFFTLADLGSG